MEDVIVSCTCESSDRPAQMKKTIGNTIYRVPELALCVCYTPISVNSPRSQDVCLRENYI